MPKNPRDQYYSLKETHERGFILQDVERKQQKESI